MLAVGLRQGFVAELSIVESTAGKEQLSDSRKAGEQSPPAFHVSP